MKEIRPGVWRLRVYSGRRANGTPIQITKTITGPDSKPGSGIRLAKTELAKMRADVSRGTAETSTKTVGDLLDRWLDHISGHSPTTLRKYRSIVETVVRPELGHIRLSKLKAERLDQLYSRLTAKGNKATTVRRVHALIAAALHQGQKWDWVVVNVAQKASPPPVHAAEIIAPAADRVQAIIAGAEIIDPALATLYFMAALTGARRGELIALRWSDVDWADGTIAIARSVYETQGGGWGEKSTKTHQSRPIALDVLGMQVLRQHRTKVDALADSLGLVVPAEAFMFSRSPVGSEPIRPDVVSKTFAAVCRRLEEPALAALRERKPKATRNDLAPQDRWDLHLHTLRHFMATDAFAKGYDAITVSRRLGHKDPSITMRVYAHPLEARDRDLASSLGSSLALPSGA